MQAERIDWYVYKHKMLSRYRKCFWCRCDVNRCTATIDHLIPLSNDGPDEPCNLVLACSKCNHERGQVTEFIDRVQFECSIDTITFKRVMKRYVELLPLFKKWERHHLRHCPSVHVNVDELMNDFAKAV